MFKGVNKFYRHFKGSVYYVLDTAFDTKTMEQVVVYVSTEGDNVKWTRPLKEWADAIKDRPDNVTGQTYRFEELISIKDLLHFLP